LCRGSIRGRIKLSCGASLSPTLSRYRVARPRLCPIYASAHLISTDFSLRLIVTGNAGSGKSTAARQIADITGVPLIGLDLIVWRPGWRKTPTAERSQLEIEIAKRQSWIVDGVSSRILAAADLVLFLDYPRRTCFWRCIQRNWRYLFQGRPELPPQCPEIKIIPQLFRLIWNFPRLVRPSILKFAEQFPTGRRFVHVKSGRDLNIFLDELRVRYNHPLDRTG